MESDDRTLLLRARTMINAARRLHSISNMLTQRLNEANLRDAGK